MQTATPYIVCPPKGLGFRTGWNIRKIQPDSYLTGTGRTCIANLSGKKSRLVLRGSHSRAMSWNTSSAGSASFIPTGKLASHPKDTFLQVLALQSHAASSYMWCFQQVIPDFSESVLAVLLRAAIWYWGETNPFWIFASWSRVSVAADWAVTTCSQFTWARFWNNFVTTS